MRFRPLSVVTFLVSFTLLLTGCATSTIKSSWRDTSAPAIVPHRIAVFVSVKDDENLRKMAENRIVQRMPKSVQATAGHLLDLEPRPETDSVRRRLIEGGFDSALVARLVSVDKTQTVVPPQTQFGPDPFFWRMGPYYRPYYNPFFTYYPYTYDTPGYTVDTTRVVVETLLYRLADAKPVWSAVTESVNPESSIRLVDELIDLLGKRLRDERLLPPD
ncbi:MAG: hypothetical protein EKK49_17325 [Rhodocyclaceae bacterium]|nr:MAG: hypothetical protein EKK49_17325 [Rhodocyclaceae bacterium]